MVINRRSILALALSGLIFGSIACAEPAKLEICAACHGEDGSGAGFTYVPIIAGTPAAHLEEALFAYLDGARRGELIHQEHCAKCHVLPDNEDVESALGIPLHGQRAAYLRLALGAYFSGDRDTLVPVMAEKLEELDADKIEALVNYYAKVVAARPASLAGTPPLFQL